MRFCLAAVLLLGLLVPSADAQTILGRPYVPNQIVVEGIVPDTPDEASALSGATFFTAAVSLTRNIEMMGELPVARFSADGTQIGSTSAVGNPYIGFGLSSTTWPLLIEVGARIPTAPTNPASGIGRAADVGRTAAFGPDEFSFSTLFNTRISMGQRSSLRLRAGTTFASSDEIGPTDENETAWRLQYEAQLWDEGERLIKGLSILGRAAVTSPGTTQHHLSLSVMPNWNRVQPGVVAGFSLNDLVNDGTFSQFVGLTLSISHSQ